MNFRACSIAIAASMFASAVLAEPIDFSKYYPSAAEALGIQGYAVIGCSVTEQGRLKECSLKKEIPTGLGFGKAALSMYREFSVKMQMPSGQALDRNQMIMVPIRFPDPVRYSDNSVLPSRNDEKWKLAIRIANSNSMSSYLERQLDAASKDIDRDDGVTPMENRQAASVAIRQAARNKMPEMRILLADMIASSLSLRNIRVILEATDRGIDIFSVEDMRVTRKERAALTDWDKSSSLLTTRISNEISLDARGIYCSKHDCEIPPPKK